MCGNGVGVNSVQCTRCSLWVHARCSGIGGNLTGRGADFVCSACDGTLVMVESPDTIELAGETLECVREFCYLGDMISADGGAVSSSVARVRSGWKSFRELQPLLTKRGLSLRAKGQLYAACVRSVMLYGSETWPVKVTDVMRLRRTEMRMVRWMCGAAVRRGPGDGGGDGVSSAALRDRLGIQCISEVMRKGRLRWFGHVSRMPDDSGVAGVMRWAGPVGNVGRGGPRKTWHSVIREDIQAWGLADVDVGDRARWSGALRRC